MHTLTETSFFHFLLRFSALCSFKTLQVDRFSLELLGQLLGGVVAAQTSSRRATLTPPVTKPQELSLMRDLKCLLLLLLLDRGVDKHKMQLLLPVLRR